MNKKKVQWVALEYSNLSINDLLQERRQRKNQNIILTLHFLFPLVVLCRLHDARMLYNLKNFHLYENALSCYKKIKFFCLQAVIKYYITRY